MEGEMTVAHYTIYGITTDTESIFSLTSTDFDDDNFARYRYDWWSDIDAGAGEIAEDLAAMLGGTDGEGITAAQDENGWYVTFTQEAIDRYFRDMHLLFWNHVCDLMKITEPEMLKAHWIRSLWDAWHCYSDETGDMIFSWDDGWQSPQDFMRSAEPGTRYYICGAVDARC